MLELKMSTSGVSQSNFDNVVRLIRTRLKQVAGCNHEFRINMTPNSVLIDLNSYDLEEDTVRREVEKVIKND